MSVFQDELDSYLKNNNVQIVEEDEVINIRKKGIEKNERKKKVSSQLYEISKNKNMNLLGSSEENKLCMKYQGNYKIVKF